ncbi:MAG: cell division protein FtsI (penicillin-binding protein 3) [Parcubacteria group bacterium Athens0714_26]|nr:MAG: cell division protein FtsI (penicillin-binding protein 3) [Parcubacteria group bacterium Athens1014_26]TSD03671.1 MAG: cell division protein FtsI (penicillin-binding protein 3) [Parcubacteria group bacterium Athens0714_26]
MKKRLLILSAFFAVLYLGLIYNLYNLQIQKGSYFSAKAAAQNSVSGFLAAVRGNIYFTNRSGVKIPAAINKEYPVIYAIPKEIKNPSDAADKLASILNLDRNKLFASLSKNNDPYEHIADKVEADKAEAIGAAGIEGIYIEDERFRSYQYDSLAAHVLGFTAPDADSPSLTGKYGIEAFFDKQLSGMNGKADGDKIIEPQAGQNIVLTIDPDIQAKAEDVLLNLVQKFSAEGGTVIVQEPKTGKILALGNYPTFDPNNYSVYSLKDFLNPATQSIYEPGSIFKVITMATGLSYQKFTPDTAIVDNGSIRMDGKTIKNWDLKAHGKVTMTEVIEQSINIGAVKAGQLIGKDLFYKSLVDFGFDEKTGIELPGELAGNIRTLKTSFKDVDFATATFGQGIAVSPIRLINAISAIANGGLLMKPFITADSQPQVVRRVISSDAALKTVKMMVSAVDKAKVAQILNYNVAGKTGTAQFVDVKCGGYCKDVYIHSYVGFAPAYDSRFIILIKLDKPNVTLAGATVVPAFRELAEFTLNYYNIPPDNISNNQ